MQPETDDVTTVNAVEAASTISTMTLGEMVAQCYQQAVDKGWVEKDVTVIEQVALIHSEASEALESWRDKQPLSWTDSEGKPQGVASEYADILIRIGHYCRQLGIDLEYEVRRKLAFNAGRPYRHGGKRA
jgi:NTP pyrophosphatase (non-canonical NTP hydrolase)